MKEIDEFLDRVFKQYKASKKEINDLRSEMKSHLLETVYELEQDGIPHQESIRIATERFGEAELINKELPEVIGLSRRCFLKKLIISSSIVAMAMIALIVNVKLNSNKENIEKLQELQRIKKVYAQELMDSQGEFLYSKDSMVEMAKLENEYSDSEQLSKDLAATYNIDTIDDIAEMNKVFRYHNGVLITVAIIASETDYECPYFKQIAQLGVMKLSDSVEVLCLAEKAREAKNEEDYNYIEKKLKELEEGAEFTTFEQALDYNKIIS